MYKNPIRILEITSSVNVGGGMDSFLMNYFRNVDRTKVIFDFLVYAISDDCSYVDEIESYGGRVYLFPAPSAKNIQKISQKYENLLEKEDYKIVHCHLANAAFIFLRIAKKKHIPVRILHSHQDRAADVMSRALRNIPLIAVGKQYANKRVACSKQAGDYLFKNHPYQIIRNGIDYSDYLYSENARRAVRHEYGIEDHEVVIGHTGRLVAQKNQKFLIETFKYIQKEIPSKLLIIGDGRDRKKLMDLADSLELSEYVIFAGIRRDISSALCAMDTFVFPSLYEGLGISLLEAQASGLACYCSDRVPKDVDISGNVIFLPLESSAVFWAKKILEHINEKKDRKISGMLDDRYDIHHCAGNLMEYYLKELP